MATDSYSPWYYWTASSCTSSTSSTTSAGDIWGSWNTSTATTASTGDLWTTWNIYAGQPTARIEPQAINPRREQAEHARRIAAEAQEKRYAEIQRKRDAAEKKAQQLLLDLIGPEQLEVYKETGRLYVRGRQHDYILKRGGLVTQVGQDKIVDLCVHLAERSSFPETDNVVGLKLLLESEDERKVLKLANYQVWTERLRDKAELPLAACM